MVKIAYLLTCRVLGLAVLVFRGNLAKDAELLVLRHERQILFSSGTGFGLLRKRILLATWPGLRRSRNVALTAIP
jgi:hypothetical protein